MEEMCRTCGRDWMCSIACGLSVHSNLLVLNYAMYAMVCLNFLYSKIM